MPRMLAVMTTRIVQIGLRVEVDGADVRGVADDGTGTARPFHGWLGLICALDALLADDPPSPDPASAAAATDPTT